MLRSTRRAIQYLHHFQSIATRNPANFRRMSHSLYTDETPASIKEAKGLHLITQSTPNGQKVQILLEELKDVYGTEWTTSFINIMTNEQKKDWFLRLNPNGWSLRISYVLEIGAKRCLVEKVVFRFWWTTINLHPSRSWKHRRNCSTC